MKNSKHSLKMFVSLAIVIAVVGISAVSGFLGDIADELSIVSFDAMRLVRLALMILFVLAVAYLLQFFLNSVKLVSKRAQTIATVTTSLIQYIAAIVILCWGLTILGVSLSTVFAGVGILALVVGFGAESLIADVITGMFMLFENQCNVGDIVDVNGFRGTIQRIGIRTTAIVDGGDNVKIINNSDMKNILNRSAAMSRATCDVTLPYEADLAELERQLPAILNGIFERHKEEMLEAPIYSGVQQLGALGMTLRFSVLVNEDDVYSTARLLNRELYLVLKQQGISPAHTPYVPMQ